ncbi:MAG: Asp23/Gls24 family envelope stress response protein, partial [Rubrobacteraceae bacterium]
MTEERQERSDGNALVGERGNTKISDGVVSTIAGIAADQVPGVHMGGGASRNAGGLMESVTGSQPNSRGISVEVGQTETALDLSMAVEYGRDILQAVDAVRSSVKERIEYMTGLKVTELNITINDILSPEKANDNGKQQDSANETVEASGPPTRTMPRSELREGASERESTRVEPTSRTHSESGSGPVPQEPVRAEGEPVGQDETVEIKPGDVEDTDKTPSS